MKMLQKFDEARLRQAMEKATTVQKKLEQKKSEKKASRFLEVLLP